LDHDEPFYSPKQKPQPARQSKPGERLFEFSRASDGASLSCELRAHGEDAGFEVQFLLDGELLSGRGDFPSREMAILWADHQREQWLALS
jgi:hypothetical protein